MSDGTDDDDDVKEIVTAVVEYLDEENLLVQEDTAENADSDEATLDDVVEQFTAIQERTLDHLEHLTELKTEAQNGHEANEVNEEEPNDAPVKGATGREFY